jgi:hypothetical protein
MPMLAWFAFDTELSSPWQMGRWTSPHGRYLEHVWTSLLALFERWKMLKDIALRSGIRCWKLMQMQLGCVAGLWLEIIYFNVHCVSMFFFGSEWPAALHSIAGTWLRLETWRVPEIFFFRWKGRTGKCIDKRAPYTPWYIEHTHTLLYTLSSFNQNPGSRPIASASLFLEFVQYPPPNSLCTQSPEVAFCAKAISSNMFK